MVSSMLVNEGNTAISLNLGHLGHIIHTMLRIGNIQKVTAKPTPNHQPNLNHQLDETEISFETGDP